MGEKEIQQRTIVTLTTDFGSRDYYVPLLKGSILSKVPDVNLVDLTHEIGNYDITRAAFIFKNAWHHFPEGTIHLLTVNDSPEQPSFVIFEHENHFFLGPDNGIFSLVFDPVPTEIFRLPAKNGTFFDLKDIFSHAISHVCQSRGLYNIGEPLESLVTRISFQPVLGPSHIRGAVIHVDNYDNVITNISRALFEKISGGREFMLTFKGHAPITTICQHYHDVPIGEVLCLFNSADHLEVAINMGNAAGLLGFDLEDTIQIDFLDADD